jgi:hypothetical protein
MNSFPFIHFAASISLAIPAQPPPDFADFVLGSSSRKNHPEALAANEILGSRLSSDRLFNLRAVSRFFAPGVFFVAALRGRTFARWFIA